MEYKNIVYVSHPYGGDIHNKEIVEDLIKWLQKQYPTYLFVSPIHTFSFLYDETEYQQGLNMCLWLLDKCDEVWVFGDYYNSVGCMSEIAYCQNNKIQYHIINADCSWKYVTYSSDVFTNHEKMKQVSKKCEMCTNCGLVDYDEYYLICKREQINNQYEKMKKDKECNE